ncbi:MAG TPA: response regulator transcription factor [Chloroflexota bacterium]|nr:response regulator transcription factor [Chloroflexota bacterium]
MKVLLAHENRATLDITTYALRQQGMGVVTATGGKEALRRWEQEQPEVVVLSMSLSACSALEVCCTIRHHSPTSSIGPTGPTGTIGQHRHLGTTPIVLLIEDATDAQIARGTEAGATLCLSTPLHVPDLVRHLQTLGTAHIAATRWVSREARHLHVQEPARPVTVGALHLDADRLQGHYGEHTAQLTRSEFRLLYLLALNAGQLVPNELLAEYALGQDYPNTLSLRVHMTHMRRKLGLSHQGKQGTQDQLRLTAVPRMGYRLEYLDHRLDSLPAHQDPPSQ